MEFQLLLSFLGASIILTFLPGPDLVFVLTESITKGAKTGRTIALGLVSGVLVHTTLAATGLSIIILNSPTVYSIVKYAGAAYLFYLAYQSLFEEAPALDLSVQANSRFEFGKLFRKGFLMNVLNPKVSIFFIAFLPKFLMANGWSPMVQMLVLGAVFILQAIIIFWIVAGLSGKLSKYLANERVWNYTKYIKAAVFVVIAVSLILE